VFVSGIGLLVAILIVSSRRRGRRRRSQSRSVTAEDEVGA
jgi:hypothetical protein